MKQKVQLHPSSSTMGKLMLATMECLAASSAFYGLFATSFGKDSGIIASAHNSLWFLFAIASNTSGMTSILLELWESFINRDHCLPSRLPMYSVYFLQFHYFFAWLGILVGYAGIVTQTWMVYYPMRLSHMHLALIGVPIIAWLKRKSRAIVVTTQLITLLTAFSHAYISFAASNYWGLGASLLMTLQILSMSLPLRCTFFIDEFSTREASILFCTISSQFLMKSIQQANQLPRPIHKLY